MMSSAHSAPGTRTQCAWLCNAYSATRLRPDQLELEAEFVLDNLFVERRLGVLDLEPLPFTFCPPRPPDRPDFPAWSSSAEELIAAIGLEP